MRSPTHHLLRLWVLAIRWEFPCVLAAAGDGTDSTKLPLSLFGDSMGGITRALGPPVLRPNPKHSDDATAATATAAAVTQATPMLLGTTTEAMSVAGAVGSEVEAPARAGDSGVARP